MLRCPPQILIRGAPWFSTILYEILLTPSAYQQPGTKWAWHEYLLNKWINRWRNGGAYHPAFPSPQCMCVIHINSGLAKVSQEPIHSTLCATTCWEDQYSNHCLCSSLAGVSTLKEVASSLLVFIKAHRYQGKMREECVSFKEAVSYK